ncbi:MAG: hypothetical protein LBM06_09155 [Prevotellaceae bacterium]|nr:hypothetical protein [Prevotellaceae bacterium]
MRNHLLFMLLPLLFAQCGRNPYASIEQHLTPDTVITTLSDSSFFSSTIASIRCDDAGLYLTDFGTHSLIALDPRLRLTARISRHGEGPKEFIGLTDFHREDSLFYILDDAAHAIKSVSIRNHYHQTIRIPSKVHVTPWNRFGYRDALFYLPTFGDTLVSVVDKSGQLKAKFGINRDGKKNLTGRKVLCNDAGVWCVSTATALIEHYSYQGQLLKQIDYSDIPFVRTMCDRVANTDKSFVLDAYLDGDNLYLLIHKRVICFSPNRLGAMQVKAILHLPQEGFYRHLCAYRHTLFCFNTKNNAVERYSLNL